MTPELKSLKAKCEELTAQNNRLFTEVGELKLAVADREKKLTAAEKFTNKQSEALKAMESAKVQLELAAANRNRDFSREASLSYSSLSSVLADLGADVASIGDDDHGIFESVFFEWLKVELNNFQRF